MKKPRYKDLDPDNYMELGDIYECTFNLHYYSGFQCPMMPDCIPPTLKAMIKAIPKVADCEHYYASARKALKETMYQSNWFDGGSVWNEFLKQRHFVSRYPVLQFDGNVGSIWGDFPSSMFFLSVKLNEFGEFLLHPAHSERPLPIPYALINGHYSRYTNILPHNLTEIIDALILLTKEPNASLEQILEIIKGPDFPFGGEIRIKKEELLKIYQDGQGDLKVTPVIEVKGNDVYVSEFAPMIDDFGVDEFDLYDFEKEICGRFERGSLHFKAENPNQLVQTILNNPILSREIPLDFNFFVYMQNHVGCFGIKKILTDFITNLLKGYSKYYGTHFSKEKQKEMIIDEWLSIKERFGDSHRTRITLI